MKKAILALADGTVFEGRSLGHTGETSGEVVFNTSMTGYQEILTDPSYKGQMVMMTCCHIGNYGIAPADDESRRPWLEGFIVNESTRRPSNWPDSSAQVALVRYFRNRTLIVSCCSGLETRSCASFSIDSSVPG